MLELVIMWVAVALIVKLCESLPTENRRFMIKALALHVFGIICLTSPAYYDYVPKILLK